LDDPIDQSISHHPSSKKPNLHTFHFPQLVDSSSSELSQTLKLKRGEKRVKKGKGANEIDCEAKSALKEQKSGLGRNRTGDLVGVNDM
jgi:hypothetical protein